jgi:hypothetical protein
LALQDREMVARREDLCVFARLLIGSSLRVTAGFG